MKNRVRKIKDTKLSKLLYHSLSQKHMAETFPHKDSNKIYIQLISILEVVESKAN